MAFKSIQRMFRAVFDPGSNAATPATGQYQKPVYYDNDNADPLSDVLGAQYMRDITVPAPFNTDAGVASSDRYPIRSIWQTYINTDVCYIGRFPIASGNAFFPCALYQLIVTGGPGVPDAWSATPTYVQIHKPVTGAPSPPSPGDVPDYVFPLKREPDFLQVHFNEHGPLISDADSGGGMTLVLSSTRTTYTAVVAPNNAAWQINWSFLGQRIYQRTF